MTLVAEYTRIEKTIVIHSEGQQNVEIPNVDAGANVLALESGETIIVDQEKMVNFANKHKMVIVAV